MGQGKPITRNITPSTQFLHSVFLELFLMLSNSLLCRPILKAQHQRFLPAPLFQLVIKRHICLATLWERHGSSSRSIPATGWLSRQLCWWLASSLLKVADLFSEKPFPLDSLFNSRELAWSIFIDSSSSSLARFLQAFCHKTIFFPTPLAASLISALGRERAVVAQRTEYGSSRTQSISF